ncbi:MAG: prepilin-type N-terminal cleavage/methylation domain-containing protein [bacterium]
MKKISNNAGFTLLETIIAVTLSSLIFLLIANTYDLNQKIYNKTDNKSEITQNGRVILDRLSRELRQTQYLVTELPTNTSNPNTLPDEIMFQDGHDTSQIKYIRYYLDNGNINRQIIVYYFPADPNTFVRINDTDQHDPLNPASSTPLVQEDKIIGEYVSDIEFWGNKLVNINLYLSKNNETEILNTAIYGRNL